MVNAIQSTPARSSVEIREDIAALLDEANDISAAAEAGKRDISPTEEKRVTAIFAEVGDADGTTGLRAELKDAENRERDLQLRRLQNLSGDRPQASINIHGIPSTGPDEGVFEPMQTIIKPRPTEWRDAEGKPVHVLRPQDRMVDHVKDRDAKNPLSIGRLVCALAANDKRRAPAEFKAAMSESANVGGGFMVNEELSSQIIDIARAQSRFVQAGAMTVPMASETLRIARVSADPAMQVKAENSAFTESSITFDAINFTAYLVGCYVVASRELFADAPNAADLVEQTLGNALGAEIDRLCIRGDGDQEPVGALNTSGIGSTSSVSAIAWEDLHTGAVSIRALNYEPNGYIVHPTIAGDLDILATGDGSSSAKNWLGAPPSLDGVTRHQTTNITTADILIGDFTKAFIGMRQEAQVEVSTTAESFFSKHQVGVKITLRFDCNLAQAGAFHALNGITT